MSCNGCRVLRKGCSENCILRPCLQWIESPESQGHATVFVAKFFGRAGLMSFISAVPEPQRPALFQSLLFEAAGRTVNPVNGAVGLLWTGNWNVCQEAVETVLGGGTLRPMPEFLTYPTLLTSDESSEVACTDNMWSLNPSHHTRFSSSRSRVSPKRKRAETDSAAKELDLRLTPGFLSPHRRPGTPSEEDSVTTAITTATTTTTNNNNNNNNNNNFSFFEGYNNRFRDPYGSGAANKLLDLFI